MSYTYAEFRPKLFTEEGVELLTTVRNKAKELIAFSGAFRLGTLISAVCGGKPSSWVDSWMVLAAVDYMIEKEELVRCLPENSTWAQYQVFIDRVSYR